MQLWGYHLGVVTDSTCMNSFPLKKYLVPQFILFLQNQPVCHLVVLEVIFLRSFFYSQCLINRHSILVIFCMSVERKCYMVLSKFSTLHLNISTPIPISKIAKYMQYNPLPWLCRVKSLPYSMILSGKKLCSSNFLCNL